MIRNLKKAALLIIMVLSVVVSFTACQLPPEILAMLGLSAAPQDEGMKLETAYVMAKAAGFTESEEAFYDQMAGNYYSVAGQVGVKNSQIEGGKFVITLTNGAKIDCGTLKLPAGVQAEEGSRVTVGGNGKWQVGGLDIGIMAYAQTIIKQIADISVDSSNGQVDKITVTFKDGSTLSYEVKKTPVVVSTEMVDGKVVINYSDGSQKFAQKEDGGCSICDGEMMFVEAKAPTCTLPGNSAYVVCRGCGFSTYEEIVALGHDEGEPIVETEATCTEGGASHVDCERCGMTLRSETVAPLGHDVVDGVCQGCGKARYTVSVSYVYGDGSAASDSISVTLWEGEEYSFTSPDIEGFRTNNVVVAGTATSNVEFTVLYESIVVEKITRIRAVELGNVSYNTPFAQLLLPRTVTGITNTGREVALVAYWDSANYDKNTIGQQVINGTVAAGYGYVLDCSSQISAAVNVVANVITEIVPMNLGRLPLNTTYDGLGLPATAAVKTQSGDIYYMPVSWNYYDYKSDEAGEHTIYGNVTLEEGFSFGSYVSNRAEISFTLSETMYGTADIVFLVDTTGSMWDEIQNVRRNITRFAAKLEEEGVSVRWALLEYRDITCDGVNSTRVVLCGTSNWYVDVTAYERALASLSVNGGGDREETVIDALYAAGLLDKREGAKTFNIVVTDADYKNANNYDVENMEEMIGILNEAGTITSVVTKSTYYNVYRQLTDGTGGILANIDSNFADELWRLSELIAEEVVYGEVESIEVVQKPGKTVYESGDYFSGNGMVVMAHYASGLSRVVTSYSVMPCGALQLTDTALEINYRGKTTTLPITVRQTIIPVQDITVMTSNITLEVGKTYKATASVVPSNATNKNVVWSTMNPNVATVVGGRIEAVGVGETTIEVATDDGIHKATITVTVIAKKCAVEGIVVSAGAIEIIPGDSFTPSVIVLPTDATNKNVVWESSDESVATVTDGVITAVSEGNATLTVTTVDGGYSAKIYVVSAMKRGSISGRINISGVTIKAYREGSDTPVEIITTSTNYSLSNIIQGNYRIVYEKDGYMPAEQICTLDSNTLQIPDLRLVRDSGDNPGRLSGTAKNATTGDGISGITVNLREGSNNETGEIIAVYTTNSSGYYVTEELAPGYYTLEFVDERGYTSTVFGRKFLNVAIEGGTTTSYQDVNLVNVSGLNLSSMRIVLTWGLSPSDLDSHLKMSNGTHIYFSNKVGSNANLDVDDTSSYGPETTTIVTLNENYCYNFYVYQYSSGGSLPSSNAKVAVYLGTSSDAVYEFTVPSGSGRYWNLFTYNAYTGEFTIHNRIQSSEPGYPSYPNR